MSRAFSDGGSWESSISTQLDQMLNNYKVNGSVLLDVGSNIGAHTLHAAAKGYHVWAIDALTMNHVKVSQFAFFQ